MDLGVRLVFIGCSSKKILLNLSPCALGHIKIGCMYAEEERSATWRVPT